MVLPGTRPRRGAPPRRSVPVGVCFLGLVLLAVALDGGAHAIAGDLPTPSLVPIASSSLVPATTPSSHLPTTVPTVVIESPANQTIVTNGAPLAITFWVQAFNLSAPNGTRSAPGTGQVEVLVDGVLYESVWEESPLVLPLASGEHTVTLVLVNSSGLVVPQVHGSLSVVMTHGPNTGTPQIVIWAPFTGQQITGSEVTLSFYLADFTIVPPVGQANAPNEGHIHAFLDGFYFAMITVEQAFIITGLTPGSHTLELLLVNSDHTPYSGPGGSQIMAETTFTVVASGGAAATSDEVSMIEYTSLGSLAMSVLVLVVVVLTRAAGKGGGRGGGSTEAPPPSEGAREARPEGPSPTPEPEDDRE